MTEDAALDEILDLVRRRTRLDFSLYRRPTVQRRVRNRMSTLRLPDMAAYLQLLRVSDSETDALVDRLAIKVSRFYRNAAAFDRLRGGLLAELAGLAAPRPIRAWSAGCGYGEEPHTLAMLMEEAGVAGEVLATDIDPGALREGRAGVYDDAALGELPMELRARFLDPVPGRQGRWRVGAQARHRITWRLHDLAADPEPEPPFDLVSCRNVLIYLDRATQHVILARIIASLRPGGCLMLGEAEWPPASLLPGLTAVSSRWRLFRATAAQAMEA